MLGLEVRTKERRQKQKETLEQNQNVRWKNFVAFQQSLEDVSFSPKLTTANGAQSMDIDSVNPIYKFNGRDTAPYSTSVMVQIQFGQR
jgi:hypothetical protein